MHLTIREATRADAESIIIYVQRLIEEPNIGIPLAPEEFNPTLEEEQKTLSDYAVSDNSIFLVAEVDGQIIGVLECKGGKRKATRHVVTLAMSIHKDWRNQGIGSVLMARAIAWAKATGSVKRIELFVYARNTAAIHLYKKYGFEEEGRLRGAIYQDGEYIDDLIMALHL
jgi:RimJ/RimL family protein N-acetyltransferase